MQSIIKLKITHKNEKELDDIKLKLCYMLDRNNFCLHLDCKDCELY